MADRPVYIGWSFLVVHTWRGCLDLFPSKFLMQLGAKRGPALSHEEPFFTCVQTRPSLWGCLGAGWLVPVFTEPSL